MLNGQIERDCAAGRVPHQMDLPKLQRLDELEHVCHLARCGIVGVRPGIARQSRSEAIDRVHVKALREAWDVP